jgi:hypothetical protein
MVPGGPEGAQESRMQTVHIVVAGLASQDSLDFAVDNSEKGIVGSEKGTVGTADVRDHCSGANLKKSVRRESVRIALVLSV